MKKKVLFRIGSLRGGGAEKVLVQLLHNINYNLFDIHLCVNLKHGVYVNHLPEKVNVIFLADGLDDIEGGIHKFLNKVRNFTYHHFYRKNPKILYGYKLDKDYDVEVGFLQDIIPDIALSPIQSSKKIGWVHFDINADKLKRQKDKILSALEKMDSIVAVSKMVKDSILLNKPHLKSKITVIYNAIDKLEIERKSKENILDFSFESPIVITIGSLMKYKGHDRLIDAHANLIKNRETRHHLIILGEGDKEFTTQLNKQINVLGVRSTVHLLGFKENPYPYLLKADYFVLSSRAEGFSLVVAEALALKKPVISTYTSGPVELLQNGKYGLVVENSTLGIENGIKRMMLDSKLVADFQLKSSKAILRFTPKEIIHKIEQILIKND
ncbi:MAG: glycosyltransferase [Flavobacteriales bacterium]|nr:glycosyltransferase [Flavobacteriales bacterium]